MLEHHPIPENEAERLRRLQQYKILDTPDEAAFDRITRLASHIMQTPIALVSLIDRDRQWFKSRVGLAATETPRAVAFCAHAIMSSETMIVKDASRDPRFATNPLVAADPHIRFYAGAPLVTRDGMALGTLCAIDQVAREPTEDQINALTDLAQLVIDEMDLRAAGRAALEDVAAHIKLDSLKSAFVADINHELRTPLTSIIGSIEILSSGMAGHVDEQARQLLTVAERNARELKTLVGQLLDMSKLEAGGMEFDFATTDLKVLTGEVAKNLSTYDSSKNVRLIITAPSEVLTAQVDAGRIKQVLSNLISNAIKASPRDGQVAISLNPSRLGFRIAVADEGPGIPADKQKSVFNKFFHAKYGAHSQPGTGLGLSIAKAIVEAHGGHIGFESKDGRGTTFFFELPVGMAPKDT